jgi:hypothetical protein
MEEGTMKLVGFVSALLVGFGAWLGRGLWERPL